MPSLGGAADSNGLHACGLSITLSKNVDYWIYYADSGGAQGANYQGQLSIGSQKIARTATACQRPGCPAVTAVFRIVNNDAKIQ